jgi:biopolymer transport protein ExbD
MALRRPLPRKRLSMTPLIDVIFLLLLFFMLSSTFSRFAEVEIGTAQAGHVQSDAQTKMLFLRLDENAPTLNGQRILIADLASALNTAQSELAQDVKLAILVSVTDTTSAQSLTDVLVILRKFPDISSNVIGGT